MTPTRTDSFGRAVRELRLRRELSQEAAALASGVDRAYFGHIERATQSPTLSMVWKIADGLGVKPSELVALAEELYARGKA